ncbi:hypothetical protein CRUP_018506 [Coryphaenoides rupestris]|nr:hypothetical protein CRUP_018506 [Coryphaenoides rupestris]
MPDQITVSEFVTETNEDYTAPTASNFTTRMSHCRNTVAGLEEVMIRKDTSAFVSWEPSSAKYHLTPPTSHHPSIRP